LKSAYSEIRLISHHLMPETLKEYGIRVAILDFIKQINESNKIAINCDIENHFIIEDPKIELELYSISMELLNNILKHSNAQKAKISIKRLHTNYLLFITDDGKGFDAKSEGFGLKNIKLRVKEMNGKISIYSQNFETTFKIIIPII
jgi:signal transduction histidine kinase